MKKWKLGLIVLLVLLIGFVLSIYNEFNGNPASKFYATKVLENHLDDTYPNREFRIDRVYYDFKFKAYGFNVIEIGTTSPKENGPKEYEFNVRGFLKPTVIIDGIYIENLDQDLMKKLADEAGEEIQTLLSKTVKSVRAVEVMVEFQKGQFSPDTNWNKKLKFEKPLGMHIVLDATKSTKETVLQDVKKIQSILNKQGYDYESVNINANVIGEDDGYLKEDKSEYYGYLKFATSFSKTTRLKLNDMKEFNK